MSMRPRLQIAVIAATVLGMGVTACATLQSILGNTVAVASVQAVVEFATGKYIQAAGTASQQTARAVTLKQVATDIEALSLGDAASVGAAVSMVQVALQTKGYDQPTIVLFTGLLTAILPELQALDTSAAGNIANVAVNDILSAVVTAAGWYGA